MKKHIKKSLILILALVVSINIFQFARPLLRSDQKVQRDMLKLMPIGTSLEDCIRIIEGKNKWYIPTSSGLRTWSELNEMLRNSMMERGVIKLSVEDYGHSFYYAFMCVSVILRFDEDFKLHEVEVSQFLRI
jgi:hypothetical protein